MIKADKDASGIIQKLKGINIDNLAATSDGKGIRGQSLLSTKKKGLLPHIKEAGVKRVIDLRTDGSYTKCEAMCNRAGLEYYKFPIAYDAKWSNEDIEKIPDFINELSKGDYYIGCATGVHRTDVALALNYFFNPKADVIPKIEATAVGNKGTSVVVKILSTINDICYKDKTKTQVRLSDDFAQKLGWDSVDKLLEELPKRRAALCSANGISLN